MPTLRRDQDLRGPVTSREALLTQQAMAHPSRAQRGHSLMIVQANQPALYTAIALLFQLPPPPAVADHADQVTTWEKGHGRLETRRVERLCALHA